MAEETRAVSFPDTARRIQRTARSYRGAAFQDLVQAGWVSTIARGRPDNLRAAMQVVVAQDRVPRT